jgi:hypothetical protein
MAHPDRVRKTLPVGANTGSLASSALARHRPRWSERSVLVRGLRLLRTRNPQTFREKVRYKMLRDHRPLLVTFADKSAVRDYVAARVGSQYLPVSLGIFDDPQDLVGLRLPAGYVVKPTHGSGAAIVVSATAPPEAVLPPARWSWVYCHVRPAAVSAGQLADIGRHWLSQLYGQGPNREWAYVHVPARVIVEELLAAPGGAIPDDYKFFVFHGRCRYIQVDTDRFAGRTQDFYRPDWEHVPVNGGPPWADPPRGRPERLEEMIEIAEKLGAETDFVRVDLYHLPHRIVFGELTSYPAGGDAPFDPDCFDHEFGRWWTVPRRY